MKKEELKIGIENKKKMNWVYLLIFFFLVAIVACFLLSKTCKKSMEAKIMSRNDEKKIQRNSIFKGKIENFRDSEKELAMRKTDKRKVDREETINRSGFKVVVNQPEVEIDSQNK